MTPKPLLLATLVTACAATPDRTVSSINYLMDPIEPSCALNAMVNEEGFATQATLKRRGDAFEINALFNGDLPITGIVRTQKNGTAEISFFVKLSKAATALDRREAEFAVRRADEAVYRSCTDDGKSYGDDVVIEATE